MGGIKGGLRKMAGGSNLLRPKLSVWWILPAIVSVAVGYFVWKYGKVGFNKAESMVGAATPGASGKGDLRARLGI